MSEFPPNNDGIVRNFYRASHFTSQIEASQAFDHTRNAIEGLQSGGYICTLRVEDGYVVALFPVERLDPAVEFITSVFLEPGKPVTLSDSFINQLETERAYRRGETPLNLNDRPTIQQTPGEIIPQRAKSRARQNQTATRSSHQSEKAPRVTSTPDSKAQNYEPFAWAGRFKSQQREDILKATRKSQP